MRLPFFGQRLRHAVLDVVLEVGGDALQAADRDRRFLDAAAAARRLARTIAGASQNSGKHIRFPVDHIGVAITPLGDQTDVFGNGRVCRAGPLAIDHFVKVVWRRNISRFHSYLVHAISRKARPYFACERLTSVLVVFELDHRLILLEPFQTAAQRQICAISSFQLHGCLDLALRVNAAVQHVQCSFNFERDNFAHVGQSNVRRCNDVCSGQPQNGACPRQGRGHQTSG